MPPPEGVADAFHYSIIVNKNQHKFWIQVTGGIAGVNEIYGVGLLDSNGNIEYVEPGN